MKSLLSKAIPFDEHEVVDGVNIESISINVSSANISLKITDSEKITIHYHGEGTENALESHEFNIGTKDRLLSILIKQRFKFGIQQYYIHANLDIEVPQKLYKQISLKTSSGNINISQLNVVKMNIKSTSGDIAVDKLKSDNLAIETTSGEIQLENSKSKNLALATTSGDTQLNNLYNETLFINSTSGEVEMENLISESIQIKTTSGDIEGEDVMGRLKAQASSGDIKLGFNNWKSDVSIQTSSGDVTLTSKTEPSIDFSFKSSSGECFGPETKSKKSFYRTYGDGKYKVDIKTSSGDCDLKIIS